jgi:hypothetical protein
MPGKHAPSSPWSFYLSLARAAGGVIAVVLLVVVLAVVAFGGRGPSKDQKRLVASLTPSPTAAPTLLASESPTASPTPEIRAPRDVNVKVLNGNGRTGLASRVGAQMTAAGWNVVSTTNAGRPQKISTIYYQPGFDKEALALQHRYPSFTQVKPASDAPSEVKVDQNLVAVLGADWPRE